MLETIMQIMGLVNAQGGSYLRRPVPRRRMRLWPRGTYEFCRRSCCGPSDSSKLLGEEFGIHGLSALVLGCGVSLRRLRDMEHFELNLVLKEFTGQGTRSGPGDSQQTRNKNGSAEKPDGAPRKWLKRLARGAGWSEAET
jgi:hypothetical protein